LSLAAVATVSVVVAQAGTDQALLANQVVAVEAQKPN
jgi:hypothetical protein